ncbi:MULTISPECIES: ParA family protein [Methylobacter]|uniref:Chromosome partitioning protein n=1 Tax=Methylobacter tundripaludum TaxID=173365 RepID=A0A2S6HD85_9GAMM|nr:ParA family protein [Methylobacter tundripaludum]MDD4904860.1 ParA family protein [Methylobacter tundripaludum]PPK75428.1 chromosome partitioning protein [Methylobacter tundripaludum]
MRIVAIINQKGGVGKTTTTANLCHAIAELGSKVTAIDLDPQGHLAVSLGITAQDIGGIDEAMLKKKEVHQQLISVRDNLQLITSGSKLKDIEQLTGNNSPRGVLLKNALHGNLTDQDFVFIDCPPSSGLLVANALIAADEILIPMASDFLALQGLSHLMGTIKRFEKALQRKYKTLLVMSRYSPNRRISSQVLNVLLTHFPEQILATVVRETALLAECPSFGKTILEYSPKSRSARDFRSLAHDFLESKVMYGNK